MQISGEKCLLISCNTILNIPSSFLLVEEDIWNCIWPAIHLITISFGQMFRLIAKLKYEH